VLEGLFREGAMMRWHVLWQRRLAAIGRTDMQGDPTVLMDEMDRRRGNSDIELLGDKLVGDAVKVTFHLDVIVQLYPCLNPRGKLILLNWERSQCWMIKKKIL
jgi:hypothetical protein